MSAINFGVEWNAEADLEAALKMELERLEKNPMQKDGRKLTPAQIRDATFAALASAIGESDFQGALDILADTPKLQFELGAFGPVITSLMENFNLPLAQALSARGLKIDRYEMYTHLQKNHNQEMLTYFIEQCQLHDNTNLLEALFLDTLKGFTANVSDNRRQQLRDQRGMLEHVNPRFFVQSLESAQFFPVFLTYTKVPEVERAQLASLSATAWVIPFSNWFASFPNYGFRNGPTVGLKSLKSLLAFLNDFPQAQEGWNTAVENLKVANRTHKDFVARYFKTNEEFKDTQLYKTLAKFQAPMEYCPNHYRAIVPPLEDPLLSQKMGLTSFELQELGATNWMAIDLEEKNGEAPPFEKMPRYVFPSFAHILVKTASQASLALLHSEQGQAAYVQILQEPAVLRNWCLRASVEMITAVVRACPQLTTWTDQHNNCLAHYLVAQRKENSKAFGQLVARLNHNWLLHENELGVSVKDLFKELGATTEMLNTLDNEAIKRSVKDAGVTKTRRTAPAPKRRM